MNTSPSPLIREPDSGSDPCETCGHPLSMHDAIGIRWCEATTLGVGQRACLCSGVVAEARVLTHY